MGISLFYRIVLEKSLQDGKMKIPARFVEEHGEVMRGKIQLEDPTGLLWSVKLSNCDGEIWMQDQWEEFAEHYSLRYGHLLVFQYEGNSRFRVIIFDMSATEIDYPLSAHLEDSESSGDLQKQNMEDDEDDVSIEILDSDPSSSKRKKISSSLECYPPQKITKTQDCGPSRRARSGLDPSRKHNGKSPINEQGQTENPLTKPPSFSANRKANAFQKAQAFRSENPFFMILMKQYHITFASTLYFPRRFARSYFPKAPADVILRISEKSWRVKYVIKTSKGKEYSRFQSSWISFSRDNNLNAGDVCVFELIKGRNVLLDVTIFRAMEQQCNSGTPESAIGTGMNQACKTTDCGIRIAEPGSSRDNGRIRARGYHIEESDDDDSSVEILCENSPSPIPKISKNAKKHSTVNAKRGLSFKQAVQGSGHDKRSYAEADLGIDSVLLADTNGVVFRGLSNDNDAAARLTQTSSCLCNKRAIKDSNFTSERPFFKAALEKYNFMSGGVYVPVWIMNLIESRDENVILRTERGSWPLRLVRNQKWGHLSAGWPKFSRQNCLEPGDVCVFELIKTGNVEFKVSIFKRPK